MSQPFVKHASKAPAPPRYRLYVNAPLVAGQIVPLDMAQMNYLLNVLRLEAGAQLLVFNGQDGEWRAELVMPTRKTAVLKPLAQQRPQSAPGRIRYAFAPLKAARLDYMVQKAVEMGAASLEPVLTRHTQVSRLKLERLVANAIEAAEQCGILTLPKVLPETRFADWLTALSAETLILFCDEEAPAGDALPGLCALPRPDDPVVLIGPEGGFDAAERAALLARGNTQRLSLGPRILRADTAAVAALTLAQLAFGDWG